MDKISIIIPAYKMAGYGTRFLRRAIESCPKNMEIIVACNPDFEPNIEGLEDWDLTVLINDRSGASANLNLALEFVNCDIVKVLFQDDELTGFDFDSLQGMGNWAFCVSTHNGTRPDHVPYHNPDLKELALGCNTYGSPSALAFRDGLHRFDDGLNWLMDVDFYRRMQEHNGLPDLLLNTSVKINEGKWQATNTICDGGMRLRETEYIKRKYDYL